MSTVIATVCLAASLFTCQPMEVRIVDGDTLKIGAESIRLQGINAPETSKPSCEREALLGRMAADRVADLVGSARTVVLERKGRDKYRRTLATVKVDGHDVGKVLMEEGLARKWEKRWRPGLDRWCE